MANSQGNVIFKFGSLAQYNALSQVDEDTWYIITDSGNERIYIGSQLFVDRSEPSFWEAGTAANAIVQTVASSYKGTATAQGAVSIGRSNQAGGLYSVAQGWGTSAGAYAHSEGASTSASGQGAHAEGQLTTASGNYSHSEGSGNSSTGATGNYSHVEGYRTTASGLYSHAEGLNSKAIGQAAHAEGSGTTASGLVSHAEGAATVASGTGAHAEGYYTEADQDYMTAVGKLNATGDTKSLFVVGAGTSTSVRKNGLKVNSDESASSTGMVGSVAANKFSCNTLFVASPSSLTVSFRITKPIGLSYGYDTDRTDLMSAGTDTHLFTSFTINSLQLSGIPAIYRTDSSIGQNNVSIYVDGVLQSTQLSADGDSFALADLTSSSLVEFVN